MTKAETRERRQRRLEHFFREAYALTFGLKPGERQRRRYNTRIKHFIVCMASKWLQSKYKIDVTSEGNL